jgi:hypothetical protein
LHVAGPQQLVHTLALFAIDVHGHGLALHEGPSSIAQAEQEEQLAIARVPAKDLVERVDIPL